MKVEDVMTRNIISCSTHHTAYEVAKLMKDNRISSIVVCGGGNHLGIITEHDIIERVVSVGLNPKNISAGQIMSHPLATIDCRAEIEEAARIMRDRKIKKLIVVESARIVGIVTSFDMIVAEPVIRLLAQRGI